MSDKYKLQEKDIEFIYKKLKNGEKIPDKYRFKITFETQKEYELTYNGKKRPENIIDEVLSVPFQPIKKFGKIKEEWNNKLIFGDNLQALKYLLKLKSEGKLKNSDGSNGIKLVYIDPPFGTGDIYDAKGAPAYSAKVQGVKFIDSLRNRIVLLHELLTDNGSMYVRIDYHFGHYVKVLIDEIFGKNNFKNELVINRTQEFFKSSRGLTRFMVDTDSLFFYTKREKYIFNELKVKREDDKWWEMTLPGEPKSEKDKYITVLGEKVKVPNGRKWGKKQTQIKKYEEAGKIKIKNGRVYYSPMEKVLKSNWTDIPGYSRKFNYPTENSEELLERIIKASSNKEDIVLDCFAGSGTTGAVAEKLGRKWIMIDSSKLSIYTIQKRMLNLREDIGNKGRYLNPKPFVIYNAGLYKDSGFLETMEEKDYNKFVLELFQVFPKKHNINGLEMDGILNNKSVMVFSKKNYLTENFIKELHESIGSAINDEMYIIVPQSVVRFNEDYISKDNKRYIILRIPYSIIQAIQEKNYKRAKQPVSKEEINRTIESVGFDFIYPPKVKCDYYIGKEKTIFDHYVIKIKEFEPIQISKNPIKFANPKEEALSMVMLDTDYNEKVFNINRYFFGDEIKKNNYKISIPKQDVGEKIMILYLDILGNEKKELKNKTDFMRE